MRKQRGITLIALVITIIVLLILAGVSISTIMGDNGILIKAKNASEQTEIATEKEQIVMSYSNCKLDKTLETITSSDLESKMNSSYGSGTVNVTGSNKLLTVKYVKSNRNYFVLQGGVVLEVEEILKNATSDMPIGIADDGTVVDMSNWRYTLVYFDNEDEWGYELGIESSGWTNGYCGDIIDGKIEGKVPAYILENPETYEHGSYESYFMPVLGMRATFRNEDELVYAPTLPNNVLYLGDNIGGCFSGCNFLLEAPIIPESVVGMRYTFNYCSSLKKAPIIPKSVEDMRFTFSNCISLTGDLVINANPNMYDNIFYNSATNEGCDLVLTGLSSMLQELAENGSENSNIRVGN